MSQQNVEIVRRGIEAAFRRPKPDWTTLKEVYHPDHEFISLVDVLEGRTHRGARGYSEWMRNLEDVIEYPSRVEGVVEIDEDRVLAIVPTTTQGKSSGIVLKEQRLASISTVRDGKIVRTETYSSPEEAPKAVGLAE